MRQKSIFFIFFLSLTSNFSLTLISTIKETWFLNENEHFIISGNRYSIKGTNNSFNMKCGFDSAVRFEHDQKTNFSNRIDSEEEKIPHYLSRVSFFSYYNFYFDQIKFNQISSRNPNIYNDFKYSPFIKSLSDSERMQENIYKMNNYNFLFDRKSRYTLKITRYDYKKMKMQNLLFAEFKYYHFGLANEINRVFSFVENFLDGYIMFFVRYGPVKKLDLMSQDEETSFKICKEPLHEEFPELEKFMGQYGYILKMSELSNDHFLLQKFNPNFLDFDVFYHYNNFSKTLLPKNIQLKSFRDSLRKAFMTIMFKVKNDLKIDLENYTAKNVLEMIEKNLRVKYIPKFFKEGDADEKTIKEYFFIVEFLSYNVVIKLLKDEYFLTEIVEYMHPSHLNRLLMSHNSRSYCLLNPLYGLNFRLFKGFKRFSQYSNENKRVSLNCSKNINVYKLYVWNSRARQESPFENQKNDIKIKERNLASKHLLHKIIIDAAKYEKKDTSLKTSNLSEPVDQSAKSQIPKNANLLTPNIDEDQDNLLQRSDSSRSNVVSRLRSIRIEEIPDLVDIPKSTKKSRPVLEIDENSLVQNDKVKKEKNNIYDIAVELSSMTNSIEDSTEKTEISNKINDGDKKKIDFDNSSSSNDKQKEEDLNTSIKHTGLFIDGMYRTLKELKLVDVLFNTKSIIDEEYLQVRHGMQQYLKMKNKTHHHEIIYKVLDSEMRNLVPSKKMEVTGVDLEKWCAQVLFLDSRDYHWLICVSIEKSVQVFLCNKYYETEFQNFYFIENCFDEYSRDKIHLIEPMNTLVVNCKVRFHIFEKNVEFAEIGDSIKPVLKRMNKVFLDELKLVNKQKENNQEKSIFLYTNLIHQMIWVTDRSLKK